MAVPVLRPPGSRCSLCDATGSRIESMDVAWIRVTLPDPHRTGAQRDVVRLPASRSPCTGSGKRLATTGGSSAGSICTSVGEVQSVTHTKPSPTASPQGTETPVLRVASTFPVDGSIRVSSPVVERLQSEPAPNLEATTPRASAWPIALPLRAESKTTESGWGRRPACGLCVPPAATSSRPQPRPLQPRARLQTAAASGVASSRACRPRASRPATAPGEGSIARAVAAPGRARSRARRPAAFVSRL